MDSTAEFEEIAAAIHDATLLKVIQTPLVRRHWMDNSLFVSIGAHRYGHDQYHSKNHYYVIEFRTSCELFFVGTL